LSRVLESTLGGSVVSECFSQSKDELILRFEIREHFFVIRASLLPDLSCLSFPENFQRARKNSVDLFPEIIGRRVVGVRQFSNERSFSLAFSDGFNLLFKMHGNRTNVILFDKGVVLDLFRKNLSADLDLTLETLDRSIDFSHAFFLDNREKLRSVYFTFGKIVWKYLDDVGFFLKDASVQWEDIQSVLQRLNHPRYYITMIEGKPSLSLLETGDVKKVYTNPVDAANEFYYTFTHLYTFSREKASLLNYFRSKLEAGKSYCEKTRQRLDEVKRDDHYRLWADLIMANIHKLKPGSEKIILENIFDAQQPVEIKLKKDMTPQKSAAIYYKKAKNQHIEIERLESAIRQKEEELIATRQKMEQVEAVSDLKSLRVLKDESDPEQEEKNVAMALPYHEFQMREFRIWVGKNARSNDVLTFRYGHKDDLWLHVKDVPGSHVLIKHQAGKNFPKDVIEYAASLAAFNSKRKNESLCAVIAVPRKFVRKRKGDPPGAVVVEREDIILVEPARIS
jgi:predicted ribosome quality control (RQC) complex YloA/Tae2 family protein